jgi:hypothetical protein
MSLPQLPDPAPEIAAQLDALALAPGRPLVVCDADEVIFDFMGGFVAHLGANGLRFTWESYRLNGNIRRADDGAAIPDAAVKALVADFFARHTEGLPLIPGAAEALAALAGRSQVVVLSNLPLADRPARLRALAKAAMPYPLDANWGSKGPAVRVLAERVAAPVAFVDDSPTHHADVARAAARVRRYHFVGHPRLAPLIGPAPDSHLRVDDWPALQAALERDLGLRDA